jgi:hypothetical protein
MLSAMDARTKRSVSFVMRPLSSMMQEMPVFAERAIQRRFSTARRIAN